MLKLEAGQKTLNQIPFEHLKLGDKVTSLVTGNKGEIVKLGVYIHISYKNGNKSIQKHGVYSMIRYDEEYNGPDFLAECD